MDTSAFHLNNKVNSHVGFIAQEMKEIFPDPVAEKMLIEKIDHSKSYEDLSNLKRSNFLTVNHMGLIPILTKAIQEQQIQIESYEERISKLESQLQELLEK